MVFLLRWSAICEYSLFRFMRQDILVTEIESWCLVFYSWNWNQNKGIYFSVSCSVSYKFYSFCSDPIIARCGAGLGYFEWLCVFNGYFTLFFLSTHKFLLSWKLNRLNLFCIFQRFYDHGGDAQISSDMPLKKIYGHLLHWVCTLLRFVKLRFWMEHIYLMILSFLEWVRLRWMTT